ncbi:MAG: HEAT repeat domain-containing protein [Treponema sp.]|jgi:HEAT repeat protein|nr:HEAT repeat domain-containing protein [Treponema sp.]
MKVNKYFPYFCTLFFLLINTFLYAQNNDEASHRATIQFGTETEIANLIQSLRSENIDYLDDELIKLIDTTRNQRILSGVFGFFGEREKPGLETRAIKAITERDDETNETVVSAIDYLGRIKSAASVPVIIELLDTQERRFLNIGFRALGRAGSATPELADTAADFLIDYYENRDPGSDNQREVIIAIGATGSSVGVPLLIDIVTNTDERIPLRIAALDALAKIGDPKGMEAILGCVGTNDPNVRSAAVAALGPFSGEEVEKVILDAFRDSYYRTRIAAAQASRDRKLVSAVPYLQYRAERDDVPSVRDECIRALGAIAGEEAAGVLDTLFLERKNSDRVRLVSAEMAMKVSPDKNINKLIIELEDSRVRNQTALYNGLLKVLGEAIVPTPTQEYEAITRRFMTNGTLIEKLYSLDMAANNNLRALSVEIVELTKDKNESIARRARRTAETLGITIPERE